VTRLDRQRERKRNLKRASRLATTYIVVIGVSIVILLPMYFLIVISLMSDREAYDWPLPALPSFRVELMIEQTEGGFQMSVFDKRAGEFEPFGPVVFSDSQQDIEKVVGFLRRQANAVISPEDLGEKLQTVDADGWIEFRLRKRLLMNYVVFFTVTRDAIPSVWRSVSVALLTILLSLSIGGMAGYAFARYAFKGKNALKLGVLFVRMFPGVAIAIPMVIILGRFGLYDQPLGLSLIYSVGQIALTVWITASIFLSIPVDLEEAALIFGTGKWGAFRHITLPLALPGLAASAMYSFIGSWNEVIQAIVFTQFRPTFPVVVYQVLVGAKGNVNLVTAGSIAQALPAVIFTLIIRKYLLRMWGGVRV
jgi:multiple sugar transport system permease protein